jgi:hypothetical protein
VAVRNSGTLPDSIIIKENSVPDHYWIPSHSIRIAQSGERDTIFNYEYFNYQGYDYDYSVVNPLLFLGMLKTGSDGKPTEHEESGTGLKYYDLDTERLETAYANVKKRLENDNWLTMAHISSKDKFSSYESLYAANLSKLKRSRIYTADSIKRNGELAILSVW